MASRRVVLTLLWLTMLGCESYPTRAEALRRLDDTFEYPSEHKRAKRLHLLLQSVDRHLTEEQERDARAVVERLAERYRQAPQPWILRGLDETPFEAGHPHVLCGFFEQVPAESVRAHYGAEPPPGSALARCRKH